MDPEIQAQSYQYFTQEAPELLATLEQELFALEEGNSNTARVHHLMRSTHTLKGIAAVVGLETIKNVAHYLEDIFKALCNPDIILDAEVKALLFEGYECLRSPLMAELTGSATDDDAVIERTAEIFALLQEKLGDFFAREPALPSSEDLGIDLVQTLFAGSVDQDLEETAAALAQANTATEAARILEPQTQAFLGIAESTGLLGFATIAKATLSALELHPDRAAAIATAALADFRAGQQAVLAGDRDSGGQPSPQLLDLAGQTVSDEPAPEPATQAENLVATIWGDDSAATPEEEDAAAIERQTVAAVWGDDAAEAGKADVARSDRQTAATVETERSVEIPVRAVVAMQSETVPPGAAAASVPPERREAPTTTAKLSAGASNAESAPPPPVPSMTVRVNVDHLEELNYINAELLTNQNQQLLGGDKIRETMRKLAGRLRQFQQMLGNLQEWSEPLLTQEAASRDGHKAKDLAAVNGASRRPAPEIGTQDFDSLELDSYSEVHVMVQSLLEEAISLSGDIDDLDNLNRNASQTLEKQRKLLTNSRDVLLEARMLPLGDVLKRFYPVLKQLETLQKKPARLVLEGTDVLVDKAIAERLYDPLLHLVRNAFDHGLEAPERRQQLGKTTQGTIVIRAYYRGSQLFVEVRDDGRGLNFETIRQRGVEKGLLGEQAAAGMTEAQLTELLFEPGFSTAKSVNDLSGRGVGLDVVKFQLKSMQGSISVQTQLERGTTFSLQIPLSLTTDTLLLCQAGEEIYAISSNAIQQILLPKAEQIQISQYGRMLRASADVLSSIRGEEEFIHIYPLSEILNYSNNRRSQSWNRLSDRNACPISLLPLLIFSCQGRLLALEVDQIIGEQELVIRPFNSLIPVPIYLYGGSILADGQLALVIEAETLLQQAHQRQAQLVLADSQSNLAWKSDLALEQFSPAPLHWQPDTAAIGGHKALSALPQSQEQKQVLMVVDDSVTLRQTLALSLEKSGYVVIQARDGRDALEKLRTESSIDLIICDIEMPNMNGFEFLSLKENDSVLKPIPTIMLSSRTAEKHQLLAKKLGADAYITKPYSEPALLAVVSDLAVSKARIH